MKPFGRYFSPDSRGGNPPPRGEILKYIPEFNYEMLEPFKPGVLPEKCGIKQYDASKGTLIDGIWKKYISRALAFPGWLLNETDQKEQMMRSIYKPLPLGMKLDDWTILRETMVNDDLREAIHNEIISF